MEKVRKHYRRLYSQHFLNLMGKKLGIERIKEADLELIKHLLGMMQTLSVDYTLFFRTLSHYQGDRSPLLKLGRYHQPLHVTRNDR